MDRLDEEKHEPDCCCERYVEIKPFVATMDYYNNMVESYYSF